MPRFHSMLAAIGLAALLTVPAHAQTGPAGPKAHDGPKTVVKLGVTNRPDQAHLELAIRRGYFDKQGIQIETVPAGSGMDFVPAVATNQIQVATGSPNAALFNAFNRGIDIRIVADYAHIGDATDSTISLVVRADLIDSGAVKSVADLKGRNVNWAMRGSYPDVFFHRLFAKNAMNFGQVEIQTIGFGDALAAFTTKRLDAGFVIEPLVTFAQAKGMGKVMLRGGEVDPGAVLSIMVYSPAFAKNTDLATRFMVAYLMGVRDYHDAFFLKKDQDAVIAILVQHLSIKDPAMWKAMSPLNTDVNGTVNVADLKSQAAIYKALGQVSGAVPDIDKYVDTRFTEAAVERLGRR